MKNIETVAKMQWRMEKLGFHDGNKRIPKRYTNRSYMKGYANGLLQLIQEQLNDLS